MEKRLVASDIFKITEVEFLNAEIRVELRMDCESTMKFIFKQWVNELTENGDYPKDILIPVKMEDIKKSELPKYTQYIEEAYRKANSKAINDIFKEND